jgi:transposase
LCPRNDESAGKRRSSRLRKGAPWLKTTLIQCAVSGSKKKASYLHAQSKRLRQRHGPKKAFYAVAASTCCATAPSITTSAQTIFRRTRHMPRPRSWLNASRL